MGCMVTSGGRHSAAIVVVLSFVLVGCVHVKTPGERLGGAGALQAVGEYQRALDELRALQRETPATDIVMRSVLHLRVAELLLLFKRTKEAAAEARSGLALDPRVDPSDWWSRTLVLLDDGKVPEAAVALRKAVGTARVDVTEFATASWLAPLRSMPGYRTIVAAVLLNAGRVEEEQLQLLNAAGGVSLQPLQAIIAAPESASGTCSLAVVQLREPFASTQPSTRVVGELVSPRIEGTGVEFRRETVTTEVDTTFNGGGTTTHRSGSGVFWGSSLLSTWGVSNSTIRTEESVPTTTHSVLLNPQGLFAVYQYEGLDQALLQNRVAVIFACLREVGQLPRAGLQQHRAPILEVVAYTPFAAGGLPIRRAAGEPVLAQ